jgi:hypothetical protein
MWEKFNSGECSMKRELRDRWCEALRSEEYKQGQAALRRCNDTYCCIGVLTDLIPGVEWHPPAGVSFGAESMNASVEFEGGRQYFAAALPKFLAHQVGLPREVEQALIRMNDHHTSFKKIAKKIEKIVPVEEDDVH